MDRARPTANKLLAKKWQEKEMEIHLDKLKNVSGSLDLVRPMKMMKGNKNYRQESKIYSAKYIEIERENQILLGKMTSIMNGQWAYNEGKSFAKSLNYNKRKNKLIKITLENAVFMKRLREQKSQYNLNAWQAERKKEENILKNICEYQYILNEKIWRKKEKALANSILLPKIAKISKTPLPPVHQQVLECESDKFLVDVFQKTK